MDEPNANWRAANNASIECIAKRFRSSLKLSARRAIHRNWHVAKTIAANINCDSIWHLHRKVSCETSLSLAGSSCNLASGTCFERALVAPPSMGCRRESYAKRARHPHAPPHRIAARRAERVQRNKIMNVISLHRFNEKYERKVLKCAEQASEMDKCCFELLRKRSLLASPALCPSPYARATFISRQRSMLAVALIFISNLEALTLLHSLDFHELSLDFLRARGPAVHSTERRWHAETDLQHEPGGDTAADIDPVCIAVPAEGEWLQSGSRFSLITARGKRLLCIR